MDISPLPLVLLGASLTILASAGPIEAHPGGASLTAAEITFAIKGKICTTKAGAKFSFGVDGTYIYDGLWQSHGSYAVDADSITVTFANGLRRSFAISVRDGIFYLEKTAIFCATEG
ncbi:hypothetical protein FG93_06055 [Bosea sp. LC85]|uniref:hypothetical protein n=1 Tax=Bosea sp. LC85 TaxID=1502851 RepID=UPI0004E2D743|nr:hypothetical protein [Bosea sp. LC85]KFC62355.1 hypothetical protein FG93_06055 [Bosea sp. LC85]